MLLHIKGYIASYCKNYNIGDQTNIQFLKFNGIQKSMDSFGTIRDSPSFSSEITKQIFSKQEL